MTGKLKWIQWNGSDILRCEKTHHHTAWINYYPDLGYRVEIWSDKVKPQGDWVRLAIVPDLETAKMVAKLHVEGELV
jgi:hypothetical protein